MPALKAQAQMAPTIQDVSIDTTPKELTPHISHQSCTHISLAARVAQWRHIHVIMQGCMAADQDTQCFSMLGSCLSFPVGQFWRQRTLSVSFIQHCLLGPRMVLRMALYSKVPQWLPVLCCSNAAVL